MELSLKQIVKDIKDTYDSITGNTEPIKYGEIVDKVGELGGGTPTGDMSSPLISQIPNHTPTSFILGKGNEGTMQNPLLENILIEITTSVEVNE